MTPERKQMIDDNELARWRKAARNDNPSFWSADAMRKVFERLDAALEELKLLQIEFNVLKTIREHGCQCSDDDACAFVRERNHYFEALQVIDRDGS